MGTMANLSESRCANHGFREAVARCPDCGGFYCRECITEHDDRLLCTACLDKILAPAGGKSSALTLKRLLGAFQFSIGLFILWMAFYYLGQGLVSMPSSFHEGTIWEEWKP